MYAKIAVLGIHTRVPEQHTTIISKSSNMRMKISVHCHQSCLHMLSRTITKISSIIYAKLSILSINPTLKKYLNRVLCNLHEPCIYNLSAMSQYQFADLPIKIVSIIVREPFTDALDHTVLSRVNKQINMTVRGLIHTNAKMCSSAAFNGHLGVL